MPQTLCKQPAESFLYGMDFGPRLATGETITSVISVVVDVPGLTLSAIGLNGQIAFVRIAGGTDEVTYKLTFLVNTSASNIVEADGFLHVVDT